LSCCLLLQFEIGEGGGGLVVCELKLGPRAAGRIEKNQTAPFVGVRIAGEQLERVRGEPAPDYAERVAKAMAAKYWSDVIVRHFSHPLTLRLVPEPGGAQQQ